MFACLFVKTIYACLHVIVQTSSSTSRPPDGPKAEALISPAVLKAWLRRIEVVIILLLLDYIVYLYMFIVDDTLYSSSL